ncbi:MAG: NrsF family protein [Steroidobacteraceae bacterium]
MSSEHETACLIEQLAGDLQPVRRLRAPAVRALVWLLGVAVVAGVAIARFANPAVITGRLAVPQVAVQCLAIAVTGVAAIFAAFQLSVPGRSRHWVWLPVPSLAVWLAASGLGCLRYGWSLGGPGGIIGESSHCFAFIAAVSVPLAGGLFWMLSRARPIAPLPVALLGTLGVAAIAAFLLQFFHPFDVTAIDLGLHLAAVALVMGVGTALRRPLLAAG